MRSLCAYFCRLKIAFCFKGLAVGAAFGVAAVARMVSHHNLIQRAVVNRAAVVLALLDGTADAVVRTLFV